MQNTTAVYKKPRQFTDIRHDLITNLYDQLGKWVIIHHITLTNAAE